MLIRNVISKWKNMKIHGAVLKSHRNDLVEFKDFCMHRNLEARIAGAGC